MKCTTDNSEFFTRVFDFSSDLIRIRKWPPNDLPELLCRTCGILRSRVRPVWTELATLAGPDNCGEGICRLLDAIIRQACLDAFREMSRAVCA